MKRSLCFGYIYGWLFCLPLAALASCSIPSDYGFVFSGPLAEGYRQVTPETIYGRAGSDFGYDLGTVQNGSDPFFFSVALPEGSYRVTVHLGGDKRSVTTVKSECRRLMLENIETRAGETAQYTFTVNIRTIYIGEADSVRINPRETGKLIWDDKLTLEFNGINPALSQLRIVSADHLPTVFLAGNSTVVDEAYEPWCGWGQIFPRFLNAEAVVANYAESGQAANSFIASRRFDKLLTCMKPGDYLFIEFGHNDQKQTGPDRGPYTSYQQSLRKLIAGAREKGGIPILVTPMHRRRFDRQGRVVDTHGEYPDAARQLAAEEGVYLIDLHRMSRKLYEAWGDEQSKRAFVHYPAGTFPGQEEALEDDTHFNSYGGYQIARCIVQGLIDSDIPLKAFIRPEVAPYDPRFPDDPDSFTLPPTPFYSPIAPLGD
ncbi:MAG: rhamnogalacturonan acetylesterase [Rikenellaceae bacterium]|nr:rhamnogalacturonan acetylesterase [Rikenellaceae bacterium]